MEPFDVLVAESAAAAARASALGEPRIQICVDSPGWRSRLGDLTERISAVALDTGSRLSELLWVVDQLAKTPSGALILTTRIEAHTMSSLLDALRDHDLHPAMLDTVEAESGRLTVIPVRHADPDPTVAAAVIAAVARGVGGGRWLGPLGSRVGGLRVGFVGRVGWGLLGGVVSSVVVEPGGSLGEAVGGWLDVLVVDAVPVGFGAGEVVGLVEEARSLGAQVVGVESGGVPVWSGVVDVVCGVEAGPGVEVVAPSVEVGVVNPVGYRRVVDGRLAVVGPVSRFRDGFEDLVGVLREVALSVGVDVVDGSGVAALVGGWPEGVRVVDGPGEGGLIDRLRGYAGVVDHPALHGSVVDRALWVVTLCAAGVPVVVVDMSVELAELLGEELVGVLSGVDAGGLSDPEERDRVSVQTRRIALRDHARSQRWVELMDRLGMWVRPLPLVSVVLATNRREFLDHAVGQVERQSYPNVELVVVLHGDGFGDIEDADLMARLGGRVRVVRVDAGVVFGEALNRGVAASLGGLVAKMDDDDWYGADHLWDLVLAMEYSGATLVGKAAEFVYLEELDITLRRMVAGAEAYGSASMGGGALMIHRHDLDTIGGWRRVPRDEDRLLIADVMRGNAVYRINGQGYLLNRHAAGHAWTIESQYFESQAVLTRAGLALDWVMA